MQRSLFLIIERMRLFILQKIHDGARGAMPPTSVFSLYVILSLLMLCDFNAKADDKITYQDNVLPLIQANCAKCHNEDKRKADLDLTSYQGVLKGSGSGAVVISGNPDG